MIGNLGPDLFIGNTADDLLYSDAYAGTFEAGWGPQRVFAGPTAFLELSDLELRRTRGPSTSSSAAQQDDAIGQSRSTSRASWSGSSARSRCRCTDPCSRSASCRRTPLRPAGGGDLGTFVDTVLDYLSSEAILAALSELVASGVDPRTRPRGLDRDTDRSLRRPSGRATPSPSSGRCSRWSI